MSGGREGETEIELIFWHRRLDLAGWDNEFSKYLRWLYETNLEQVKKTLGCTYEKLVYTYKGG